MPHNKQEANLG